jgi:hypothetical protein
VAAAVTSESGEATPATGFPVRYLVIALAPVPIALVVAIVGLALDSKTVVYVSLAISLLAMPIGGFALGRMFRQLAATGEVSSRRSRRST